MKKIIGALISVVLAFLPILFVATASAAEIKTGDDSVTVTKPLENAYIFGGSIDINAPITNDLTTAGGNITINAPVTGDILAAGGNITISERVGDAIRVAGGNIVIDGPVDSDVVIVGGSARVTERASISGDLIFAGGQLSLQGRVNGDAHINGGTVTVNNSIGGDLRGTIGELALGSSARIGGDLIYSSSEKAKIDKGAQIQGKTQYTEVKNMDRAEKGIEALITAGTIYKLIADILFALLFILLLPLFTRNVLARADASPLKSIGMGFVNLLLMPFASLILLIILWLGITSFVLYVLLILVSIGLTKIYIGWKTLSWWYGRNKKDYVLDWKAAVVGVVLIFIVGLIPVLGWLVNFILFLLALGALSLEIVSYFSRQNIAVSPKKTRKS